MCSAYHTGISALPQFRMLLQFLRLRWQRSTNHPKCGLDQFINVFSIGQSKQCSSIPLKNHRRIGFQQKSSALLTTSQPTEPQKQTAPSVVATPYNGKKKSALPDGSTYEGDWANGQREGNGTLTYPDGESFSGTFLANQPINGTGTIHNANIGFTFKGVFENGRVHGKNCEAILVSNGTRFKGTFNHGMLQGPAEVYQPNGNIVYGQFKNGQLVKTLRNLPNHNSSGDKKVSEESVSASPMTPPSAKSPTAAPPLSPKSKKGPTEQPAVSSVPVSAVRERVADMHRTHTTSNHKKETASPVAAPSSSSASCEPVARIAGPPSSPVVVEIPFSILDAISNLVAPQLPKRKVDTTRPNGPEMKELAYEPPVENLSVPVDINKKTKSKSKKATSAQVVAVVRVESCPGNSLYFGELVNNKPHGFCFIFPADKKEELLHIQNLKDADWRVRAENLRDTCERSFAGTFVRGNIVSGKGSFRFAHGVLEAEFQDGVSVGEGTIVRSNGEKYVGQLQGTLRHGRGTVTSPGGHTFIGIFQKDAMTSGEGALIHSDGSLRSGTFKDSKFHGPNCSILYGKTGEKITGEFCEGRLVNGSGLLLTAEHVMEGTYEMGELNGVGICTTRATGERYSGMFLKGIRHGHGVVDYPDGRRLEGEYENGILLQGDGSWISPQGHIFEGHFVNGKLEGRGVLRQNFPDEPERCTVYEGQFVNGIPHGKGVTIFPDGLKMAGEYKDGTLCESQEKVDKRRIQARV